MAQFLVTFCIGDGINDEHFHATRVNALTPSAARLKVEKMLKELFGDFYPNKHKVINVKHIPMKEWIVRIHYTTSDQFRITAETAEEAKQIANNDYAQEKCVNDEILDYEIFVEEL